MVAGKNRGARGRRLTASTSPIDAGLPSPPPLPVSSSHAGKAPALSVRVSGASSKRPRDDGAASSALLRGNTPKKKKETRRTPPVAVSSSSRGPLPLAAKAIACIEAALPSEVTKIDRMPGVALVETLTRNALQVYIFIYKNFLFYLLICVYMFAVLLLCPGGEAQLL